MCDKEAATAPKSNYVLLEVSSGPRLLAGGPSGHLTLSGAAAAGGIGYSRSLMISFGSNDFS